MSLRDALQNIYDDHSRLTPRIVLDVARPVEHPLHDRFEWDDTVAGEKYRIEQARTLITSVRVVYRKADGNPGDVRKFHAVQRPEGTGYEPVEEVLRDEMATKILLADMEREWRALKRRYDSFEEFRQLVLKDMVDAT